MHNLFNSGHHGAQIKMLWSPKRYLCKWLCSEEVSYLAAGNSRTGGGRSHTREPSSYIRAPASRLHHDCPCQKYSGIMIHDWHQLQGSHYPRGVCVRQGLEVGASSSTSICGPWYGRPTKPAPGSLIKKVATCWHKNHTPFFGAPPNKIWCPAISSSDTNRQNGHPWWFCAWFELV